MTLSKNTYAFEPLRPAPRKATGGGPQSRTHALAVAQGGQSLSDFVATVTAFIDAGTDTASTTPVQASTPAPSKTAQVPDHTRAVAASIAQVAANRGKAVGFFRPVAKAAAKGTKALRAYRTSAKLIAGSAKSEAVTACLYTLGS